MRCVLPLLPAILGVRLIMAVAHTGHNYPTPPEPMDPQSRQTQPPQISKRSVDTTQIQKQADELARMAQTIPADVASVRKGMLPKDVIEKLKQIEKLSKRLRTELNP